LGRDEKMVFGGKKKKTNTRNRGKRSRSTWGGGRWVPRSTVMEKSTMRPLGGRRCRWGTMTQNATARFGGHNKAV